MGKLKIAIIGAGVRGTHVYAPYILENTSLCEIVAVAETKKGRRDLFSKKYNIKEELIFESAEGFFKEDKISDAVIISTNDDRHYNLTKLALEKGYNVLLETPMANSLDGLVNLKEISKIHDDKVFMICNSYRYTVFFNKLKEIIESKELGNLVNIEYNNSIGYTNYIHKYVRGNWRNSSDTSPLILSESCHDMDILLYLTGKKCKKISSFGNLKHFNSNSFRLSLSENCYLCSEEEFCPYSCKKSYLENESIYNHAVHIKPTKENLDTILKEGPYGRCVYRCDNNVVDNMVCIMEFDNNITATFNLSAFTKDHNRNIRLMFTNGEVAGSFNEGEIKIKKFLEKQERILKLENNSSGTLNVLNKFINSIKENINLEKNVKESFDSNVLAFAAEYSRVSEEVVYVEEFLKGAIDMTKEIENTLAY